MVLVHAILAAVVVLLIPLDAFAWGPGMHVEMAMHALNNISIVVPAMAELISAHPGAFIYGAASPDIIVGKKLVGYLHHCHNWSIGRLVQAEARGDRQRAAAYGYLVHLAADIVAHNYFIPFKIVRSWDARLLTHTYWEMRFDLGVGDEAWKRLGNIGEEDVEEFDALLDRVLRKTIFSFQTNKRIFNTIIMMQKMKGLRRSLDVYAKRSKFQIGVENRQHYLDLAIESVEGFLRDPDGAPCLVVDPAGLAKLEYAKNLRRSVRNKVSSGRMGEGEAEKLVDFVKEQLAVGLYRPDMVLPTVADVTGD